ncbi:MAG: hypothetical protein KAS66_01990 [Candidatus Omnitrophica bacterium]|nr:hypothetical protein [Candidatus Omnitrophota bacterium]
MTRKPNGYWKVEENVIKELKIIIKEIGHFPTNKELASIGRTDLSGGINKSGGVNHFREILGYEFKKMKPNGYWKVEENVIKELKIIIKEIGHFPTISELHDMKKHGLVGAMNMHGTVNYFRKKMGHNILQKTYGYWTEENTIKEIEKVIKKLGNFPTKTELNKIGKNDLRGAIEMGGGSDYFREKMGYKPLKKISDYWTEENTIKHLGKLIEDLGHFPSRLELQESRLIGPVQKYGGVSHFWDIFDIDVSEIKKKRALMASYVGRRGMDCEKIVKQLITKWCHFHNRPVPDLNVKLDKSKVIEFVCESNKKIGIDVTNTKNKDGGSIRHKWKHKEYHLHLDELWILVFSDAYNDIDYIKFNKQSPDNVKVMSIETFMEELGIIVDEKMEFKINVYNECTFHTKDELKQNMPEKKALSKIFKIRPDIRIKLKR